MESVTASDSTILSDPVQRESSHLSNGGIYVVGTRRFQNGLLVHFLRRSTGIFCESLESVRMVPSRDSNGIAGPLQVLWDFLGEEPDTILKELETSGRDVLDHHLVALLNVAPKSGIEERSVALGVRGFFYVNDPLELFLRGVYAVFAGELWLSREWMTRCILDRGRDILSREESAVLTPRETEILEMVVVGSTNDQIAGRLCISPHTVRTHIYNIFKKINVPNRFQAALWAAKNL